MAKLKAQITLRCTEDLEAQIEKSRELLHDFVIRHPELREACPDAWFGKATQSQALRLFIAFGMREVERLVQDAEPLAQEAESDKVDANRPVGAMFADVLANIAPGVTTAGSAFGVLPRLTSLTAALGRADDAGAAELARVLVRSVRGGDALLGQAPSELTTAATAVLRLGDAMAEARDD